MKQIRKVYFFLSISFLVSVPLCSYADDIEKLTLTTHNLPPYSYYPTTVPVKVVADESFTGVAVEVVRCVLDRIDIPYEILVVPWKRAQLLVEYGKADGFFAASQKDSRDEFAEISKPIADQKWQWYLLKENPLDPQDESFRRKATVAGFLGANMLDWMKENGYKVVSTPVDTQTLLRILLYKRVDAVMANNYVMEALLDKTGSANLVKSFVNKDKPLSVYFSKRFTGEHPGFIQLFNLYVGECRNTFQRGLNP